MMPLKKSLAIIVAFCLPLATPIPSGAANAPSAPEVKCQIGTGVWCIIFGVSEINLTTTNDGRIWTFLDPVSMHNGPVTILERIPNCGAGQPIDVRKISEKLNEAYFSVVYALTVGNECQLEFHLPAKSGVVDDTYKWAIRTDIEINGQPLGLISH